MDWRGRATEREVKMQLFSDYSASRATLTVDLRGQATERAIKLQFLGSPRNPCHGLAWSSERTRGKTAIFILRTQPLPWIGVVECANTK